MKKYLLMIGCCLLSSMILTGQITDIDGNQYTSVVIGTQEWLQQNLKTKRFNNGDSIPEVNFSDNHCAQPAPKYRASYTWSAYSDSVYGQLYTWFAATDTRGVCPSGFGIPSIENWDTLINYLGVSVAGGHLKESGNTHWILASAGADNSTGFTGLPGGNFLAGGFNNLTTDGYFWSSSEQAAGFGKDVRLRASYDNLMQEFGQECFGYSVRCIRSATSGLDENKNKPNLQLFPNPTTDLIRISWENLSPEVMNINCYTLSGELAKIKVNEAKNVADVSTLQPGIYFISIITKDKNYLEKIVVE